MPTKKARPIALAFSLLMLGNLAPAAHAGTPQAPQYFNVLPQQPIHNYLVTWQPTQNVDHYEVWEKDKKGSSSYLGTTKSVHWQFFSHPAGTFQYEVRACSLRAGCSAPTPTDWISVGATPQFDPPKDPPPTSVCMSADEYQKAKQVWPEYPPDNSDEGLVENGSVERISQRSWEIGLVRPEALGPYEFQNPNIDSDGDCVPDTTDPSPNNPDRDGDGWFDGRCNVRVQLVLTNITSHDEQEDWLSDDEFYILANDTRFPDNSSNDQYWDMDHGTSRDMELVIAERTRGTFRDQGFAEVVITGQENDPDAFGTWTPDDTLFSFSVDMNSRTPGSTFTVRESYSDWDYSLTFRIDAVAFADPSPDDATADLDKDGISEQREAVLNAFSSGLSDPERKDIFVEVDTVGIGFAEESVWQVVSSFARKDVRAHIYMGDRVFFNGCISRPGIQYMQDNFFDLAEYNPPNPFSNDDFGGFRYGIVTDHENHGGSSGVAQGGNFIVSKSWSGNDNERGQAGTFMHELGHTLGLTNRNTDFEGIDSIHNTGYRSSMNYTFQTRIVEYSNSALVGGFFNGFNDWYFLREEGFVPPNVGFVGIGDDACN